MSGFKPTENQKTWAKAFLAAIGAPTSANNIANVSAWEQAESGGAGEPSSGKTGGVWNPLNCVTAPGVKESPTGAGGTLHGGSQGNISNYANLGDGAAQSARWWTTNTHAAARDIVNGLKLDSNELSINNDINKFYSSWGGRLVLPGVDANDVGSVHDYQTGGDAGAATGINDPLSAIAGGATHWLTDRLGPLATKAFWVRVGEMALGFAFILVGLVMLLRSIGAVPAVKTVTSAAKGAAAIAAL